MTLRTNAARLAALSPLAIALSLGIASAQPAEKPFEPTVGQQGKDVVWVPTPQALVDRMLDMAKLTPADIHYDLGSGDGRTVITAAKRGATAFGVEYNPKMVELSRANAVKEGVTDKATFIQGDIFQTDFSKANVITLFLLPDLNERLRPTILEMKPGTRVVSNSFSMGTWQPDERAEVTDDCRGYCRAMLWIVPAKVEGEWTLDRGGASSALSLKQEFQKITGAVSNGNVVAPITGGTMAGDQITFTAAGVEYTGKVDGGMIAGTTKSGETWQAKRGAPAIAQAPEAPKAPAADAPAPKPADPAPAAAPAPAKTTKSDPGEFEPQISQDGKDVVWWPTANTLVEKMLDIAKLTPKDLHVDLGSGDGRTVIAAARRGANSLGVEFNPKMVALAQANAKKAGVNERARFVRGDFFRVNFSNADVLTLFLLPELNERLRPKILRMKPGTRVVSNTFEMGDWEPDQEAEVTEDCQTYCKALLWIVPARVGGRWVMGKDVVTLNQKFQTVTGNIRRGRKVLPITNGKLNGNTFTFTAGGTEYTGTVNGRTIDGATASGTKWSARRV
jgi:predicted RNA methylase